MAMRIQWAVVGAFVLGLTALVSHHFSASQESPEVLMARQFGAQLVDQPAIDFTVNARDGSPIRLSDLEGRVVFVNFWATWCPPCRKEMPDLEKLAQALEGAPFVMLAVSADDSWAAIDQFLGKRPTHLKIGLDPTKTVQLSYGTEKLPETYIVDRQGRVRLRFVNVQPWTDKRIVRYLEWLATSG